MKLLFITLFIYPSLLSYSHGCSKIIVNRNLPSCKNCIHFAPYYTSPFGSSLSSCQKFGTKNIISDEIHYEFADSCRKDDSKCGKEGNYFEQEPNLQLKMMKHYIVEKMPIILAFAGVSLYISVLLQ